MVTLSRSLVTFCGSAMLAFASFSSAAQAAYPPPVGPVMPGDCGVPCPPCPPPPPDVCTCTSYKPVVDTCYRTQQILGFHDVCRTCYKQEPYCQTVPVTKVDCVTVDEGCYKMVWCPKVVTKQVPRVEYHQQVCTRTVPYTVTQKVPHMTTNVVPEHRVRYVPETRTFVKPPCNPCPICPPVAPCGVPPACGVPGPYGVPGPAMTSAIPGTSAPGISGQLMPAQAMASIPAMAQPQAPVAGVPMADAQLQRQPMMTIPQTGAPAANPSMTSQYLRARANASVWAANRGLAVR
jgi:hypothetical protein